MDLAPGAKSGGRSSSRLQIRLFHPMGQLLVPAGAHANILPKDGASNVHLCTISVFQDCTHTDVGAAGMSMRVVLAGFDADSPRQLQLGLKILF